MAQYNRENTLVLFDVDGTLTKPRLPVTGDMQKFLRKLKGVVSVGIVGGSDLPKQQEQLGKPEPGTGGEDVDVTKEYDFLFSENGLKSFKAGEHFHTNSILENLGEEKVQNFVNFVLVYVATLKIPVKR
jgi:phosphomannomutase